MNRPFRLALGAAALAADRLRQAPASSGAVIVGLGLIEQGMTGARALTRRLRSASAGIAPVSFCGSRIRPAIASSRHLLRQLTASARRQGEATVAAARADATAFARDGIAWAQSQAIPQFVDGLLPHLIDRVLPRLVDGALPEVRSRVLPILIDDLTRDGRIRALALHEGGRAVSGAAQYLRDATAGADDRVENAVRHFARRPLRKR